MSEARWVFRNGLRPALRGWKRTKAKREWLDARGLRPALRGWKLRIRPQHRLPANGLRPALRGWKLYRRAAVITGKPRSPTRLEGMETHLPTPPCQVVDGSPTRLEGMETPQWCRTAWKDWGLRPALRGWKHVCQSTSRTVIDWSPTRLEGMETGKAGNSGSNIAGSPTRLEGMETVTPLNRMECHLKVSDPP